MGQAKLVFGNQNQVLEIGAFGIVTANYNDFSAESAISLISGKPFRKHNAKHSGWMYGYEFYALGGVGDNDNFLGSSLSSFNTALIYNAKNKSKFSGLGFGFQKEFLSNDLAIFNVKRGKLVLRFSNSQHSIGVSFLNDLKLFPFFNGQASDFGATGSLEVSFSNITSNKSAYKTGIGLELFTPKADYSKTPNNLINSDDGRRNVWHTLSPHKDLFYANAYIFGSYTSVYYSASLKTGFNSEKLGAFVQNSLHDSFGLNPRFPWRIDKKDKILIEATGSFIKAFNTYE